MKNIFKLLGIIALAAVIGFSMTSCDDGSDKGGSGPSALHATWEKIYTSKTYSITFKADGTFTSQGTMYDGDYSYRVEKNKVYISAGDGTTGINFPLSISADGNTLTISSAMGFWQMDPAWYDGDYTKK